MPTIDLGVDFSDVQNEDIFDPLPNGTYDFITTSAEPKNSAAGRPMIKWVFTVNHEAKDYKLFYNTVLPWEVDGEWVVSGVGMLVSVCKALGKPWSGKSLNLEDYLGLGGSCQVVQKPKQTKQMDGSYADDPSGQVVNDIGKFLTSI